MRALLDEVERLAPAGRVDAVNEQLVEELARLGRRCIEGATVLGSLVAAQRPPARDLAPCA